MRRGLILESAEDCYKHEQDTQTAEGALERHWGWLMRTSLFEFLKGSKDDKRQLMLLIRHGPEAKLDGIDVLLVVNLFGLISSCYAASNALLGRHQAPAENQLPCSNFRVAVVACKP